MKSLKSGELYLEVSFAKLELSENSFKDIEFDECHFQIVIFLAYSSKTASL